ncbi:DUF4225 domain-containing protein [Erwinia papayae]|uniref:DUF4225 domain-containing protein n=1 Tax=Erwinia papayae TaxID=206499 RepID=A0ABV3N546_9GAMM
MDNYLDRNKDRNYFLTMANLEASALASTANFVSNIHLKDGLIRMNFQDEITGFINAQISTIQNSTSDDECQQCIQNLKKEHESLSLQDRMLVTGEAVLHASVQLVNNGKFWGYVMNGVGIVLSSFQVLAGLGVFTASLGMGAVVGAGFGALLMLHGANGIEESVLNLINGKDDNEGFLKKKYIQAAEFMGFDQNVGEIAYSSMDLALSLYGIVRLVRKPQAWRLFYYLNSDFIRGFHEMSRKELFIEVYNDTISIKSIYDSNQK